MCGRNGKRVSVVSRRPSEEALLSEDGGDPEGLHRRTAGCGKLLEPPWLSVASFLKQAVIRFYFH